MRVNSFEAVPLVCSREIAERRFLIAAGRGPTESVKLAGSP
jgi:hypothetical protein